ncbi:cupin domain-containing protein [Roseibacillus ishigakijimensis]|uniref:Cupin domain-containing protein n=1 Tax=Roseibacillus ishigakijimensis TaxID=454146 RepID=A0A934RVT5_9BACT|nr:cupin domain-containing protein [Roseibacillus ishigakijimensis]MBK1835371.1 cupin domain-containing protein [Roseibacillus ishigakijimensis]
MTPFLQYPWQTGLLADFAHQPYPTSLSAWAGEPLALPAGATHYGFLWRGSSQLAATPGTFPLIAGMSFCSPGPVRLSGPGHGLVITSHHHRGLFSLHGPVEETGRLRYIDGCTDTLLIAPPRLGDPCLNLLHIPPATAQTSHTHPSLRAGLVISGQGECRTPQGVHPLTPGQIFAIPAQAEHSFHTGPHSSLRVLAYHPDSDFGPTDEDHPMVNRTIITA